MNVKESIRDFILTRLGVNNKFQQSNEKIDGLYYFLNQYVDIRKIPPAKDEDLRILQKCDALLIAIFHELCGKFGLKYWLDFGTLLGAVRHHGFVPWDDDTDISMPRKDWERALELFPPILQQYGISLFIDKCRLCMTYKHKETGIWIDIFAVDDYLTNKCTFDEMQSLKRKVENYKKHRDKTDLNKMLLAEQTAFRENLVGKGEGNSRLYWICGFEHVSIFKKEYLFPLSELQFEGISLKVPADSKTILSNYYGDYLSFPKSGLLHHGENTGRPPLSLWAKLYGGDDMKNVKEYLEKIRVEIANN